MIGMLKIKENLAASNLFSPINMADEIVIPDLDNPGITAKPWKSPTTSAVFISVFLFSSFLIFSDIKRTHPVIIIKILTIKGFSVKLWAASFVNKPKTPVINVAIKIYITNKKLSLL